MTEPTRYIYFIQSGKYIKIGITDNIHSRIQSIQTGNPITIKLIFTTWGNSTYERQLHEYFGKYRVRGEWYKYNRKIKKWITHQRKLDLLRNKSTD